MLADKEEPVLVILLFDRPCFTFYFVSHSNIPTPSAHSNDSYKCLTSGATETHSELPYWSKYQQLLILLDALEHPHTHEDPYSKSKYGIVAEAELISSLST